MADNARNADWKGREMRDGADDAWKQHHAVVERFTREWEPRPDLRVDALAWNRSVRLSLGTRNDDARSLLRHHWTTTERNVSTMRELAQALLTACDFVEQSNPVWASHAPENGGRTGGRPSPIEGPPVQPVRRMDRGGWGI